MTILIGLVYLLGFINCSQEGNMRNGAEFLQALFWPVAAIIGIVYMMYKAIEDLFN